LPVERDRGGFGEVVVDGALVHLVLHRAGILTVQIVDRRDDPCALVLQQRPELGGIDRAHPVLPAPASRLAASSLSRPSSSTTLSRAVSPERMLTPRRGSSSVAARSCTTASFARPLSAGAATRTFQASP